MREGTCLLLDFWGWDWGGSSIPSAKLQGFKQRARRGLSFTQANARCHTEEGYCMASWVSCFEELPVPDVARGRDGGQGEQAAREQFIQFYFLFTSVDCSYALTHNKPAPIQTSAAIASKTNAFHTLSEGEYNPPCLSQDPRLKSGLPVSVSHLDFSMLLS